MLHTQFYMPIRVFCDDSDGEYISQAVAWILAEQGTLAFGSLIHVHTLKMSWPSASIVTFLRRLVR